uniref:DNA2/NAM7 helicase-like C-terminal domain-containing protein n=1 Tax=Romanomermis culicivorax TaxID=13658 RepID=A0A915IKE9_ROMCU
MHIPYMLLNKQYRMRPAIGSIVSDLTYGNRVENCTTKEDRILPLRKSFPTIMTGYPIAWIHIGKEESADKNSRSLQNIGEVIASINLAASLIGQHKMRSNDIVIIMSYSAQVKQLQGKVDQACEAILNGIYLLNHSYSSSELFIADLRKIGIGTVDGFQVIF